MASSIRHNEQQLNSTTSFQMDVSQQSTSFATLGGKDDVVMSAKDLSGNKRGAGASPNVSPTKPANPRRQCRALRKEDGPIKPINLEDKLRRASKTTKVDRDLSQSIVNDEDWRGEMATKEGIIDELLKDPETPKQHEVEAYTFGAASDSNDDTWNLLKLVNVCRLEELLRAKVSKCQSRPDLSFANPNKSPFVLERGPTKSGNITVLNCKMKKALTFRYEDLRLDTGPYRFDLDHSQTYYYLCYNDPSNVLQFLSNLSNAGNANAQPTTGLFRVSREVDGSVLFTSSGEKVFQLDPNTTLKSALGDGWIPVRGGVRLSTSQQTGTPASAAAYSNSLNENRFASLADDDGNEGTDTTNPKEGSSKARGRQGKSEQDELEEGSQPSSSSSGDGNQDGDEDSSKDSISSGGNPEKESKPRRCSRRRRKQANKKGSQTDKDNSDVSGDSEKETETPVGEVTEETMSEEESVGSIPFQISSDDPVWADEHSEAEDAIDSDNDVMTEKKNLQDIVNESVATPLTDASTFSTPSNMSNISTFTETLEPNSGQFILQVTIQLVPKQDHVDTMVEGIKTVLASFKKLDANAHFISKELNARGSHLEPIVSPSDKHFPSDYITFEQYFQCTNPWAISEHPISEKTLQARLDRQRNRTKNQDGDKKRSNTKEDKGPTALYVNVHLGSHYPNMMNAITTLNIDLRKKNIRLQLKSVQCWNSASKRIIISTQTGLCEKGVKTVLVHRLKAIEKRLCRHGRLDPLKWYDAPLPEFNLTKRALREFMVPGSQAEYTFSVFPREFLELGGILHGSTRHGLGQT